MNAFEKIIGYEEIKKELSRVCDMIHHREIYEKLGAKMPKGILLYGVPGVGKSLMAHAFLEESGLVSYVIRRNRPDGEFIKRIKSVFDCAARSAPSVILLDDMDKFAVEADDREEYVTLQACIDEVKEDDVFVIATANDLDDIPRSLLRAGRFDRKMKMDCPKNQDAVRIITHFMEKKEFVRDVNCEDIAMMLTGKSCAELETVINEAAIDAAYERCAAIGMAHIVGATLREAYGVQNRCGELSEEQRESVACHEAGHAVISEVLMPGSVGMVSLSSKSGGEMGGFMLRCKDYDRRAQRILVTLGGKAAVEMEYGKVASGTYRDLDQAIDDITESVTEVGSMGAHLLNFSRESDAFRSAHEQVVHAELSRYLFKAKEILAQNRGFLREVQRELSEKGTLLYSDLRAIRDRCTLVPVAVG